MEAKQLLCKAMMQNLHASLLPWVSTQARDTRICKGGRAATVGVLLTKGGGWTMTTLSSTTRGDDDSN